MAEWVPMSSSRTSPPVRVLAVTIAVAVATPACGSDAVATPDPLTATADETSPATGASSTVASTTTTPATTARPTTSTTVPPAPPLELVGAGPHDVGVTTITIDGGVRDRPLTVDVWFPLEPGATGEPHRYTFLPGVYYESPSALAAGFGDIAPAGPYPLVLYSHGSGGLRYIHSRLTETIASHGYVVAAPDHTGNTSIDLILDSGTDPLLTAVNRPNDISAVLDELTDTDSTVAAGLVERIDADRVAVAGHSFGGFTAYALVSGYESPFGVASADERVDAVITLAPAANEALLSDDRLALVDVPSLVIAGTDDKTTPIDPNVTRPWRLAPGRPAYRVELIAAEHQTFTDVCAYLEFLPTLEAVPELITDTLEDFGQAGCQPDDMPSERAQQLTTTFVVNFLEEVLGSAGPFDPDSFELPDDVRVDARPGS